MATTIVTILFQHNKSLTTYEAASTNNNAGIELTTNVESLPIKFLNRAITTANDEGGGGGVGWGGGVVNTAIYADSFSFFCFLLIS